MTTAGLSKRTVAIFDDDEDILSICSYILEEKGWLVHVFTDCIDIVEKVAEANPTVIMMDNWIPAHGGIAATKILKETTQFKHIPVVYFSANSDIHKLADQAGAELFLAKPFDLEDLEATLQNALTLNR